MKTNGGCMNTEKLMKFASSFNFGEPLKTLDKTIKKKYNDFALVTHTNKRWAVSQAVNAVPVFHS